MEVLKINNRNHNEKLNNNFKIVFEMKRKIYFSEYFFPRSHEITSIRYDTILIIDVTWNHR